MDKPALTVPVILVAMPVPVTVMESTNASRVPSVTAKLMAPDEPKVEVPMVITPVKPGASVTVEPAMCANVLEAGSAEYKLA